MTAPLVSVIMSVYNGAADVPAAVKCILEQTFEDFELIAIDNGSFKDDTRAVLNRLSNESGDARLRVVHLDANIGLAGALNHGIGLARGRYIARQDHDDISFPERLEKQVAFLEAAPRVGLLGAAAEIWVDDAPSGRFHDHATDNATLQVDLLSNNPFVHTSVMIRKSALDAVGPYTRDPQRQPPEDFELWSRIARRCEVANLPDRLVAYREVAHSMSRDAENPFLPKLIVISSENIAAWNGLDTSDDACRAAACLIHAAYDQYPPSVGIDAVCQRLESAVVAIAAANPGSDLSRRKAQLEANARHHFMHARKLPRWTAPLVAAARRMPIPDRLKHHVVMWLNKSALKR